MNEAQEPPSGLAPPSGEQIVLRELAPHSHADASTIGDITEIYVASFPDEERVPAEDLFWSGSGRRFIAGINSATGRVIGFCSFRPVPGHPAHFLEYLATDPLVRSSGLGSRLLNACAEAARESGAAHLFMELEHPDHARSPQDAVRRITFYHRNGCEQVGWLHDYVVPNLRAPELVIPMLLFVRDLRESAVPYQPRALFEALYTMAYGAAGAPLLARIMAGMPPEA